MRRPRPNSHDDGVFGGAAGGEIYWQAWRPTDSIELPEIAAITEETGGGAKEAENLSWIVKYTRAQQTPSGQARVRFSEPFSRRDALHSPASVSRELYSAALKLADNRRLLDLRDKTTLPDRRAEFLDEVEQTRNRLARVTEFESRVA